MIVVVAAVVVAAAVTGATRPAKTPRHLVLGRRSVVGG